MFSFAIIKHVMTPNFLCVINDNKYIVCNGLEYIVCLYRYTVFASHNIEEVCENNE